MSQVRTLVLRVLLWLPLCFAAWYHLSILFVVPISTALEAILSLLVPSATTDVAAYGNRLEVSLLLAGGPANRAGAMAEASFHLHPLDYCYGIALFSALSLSVPGSGNERALKWMYGVGILFAIAIIGVASQALKIIVFDIIPQAGTSLGWTVLGYNALGFLYKFMYLIVTPLAPVALWLWQYRARFLPEIDRAPE
jgi:hypothetical protein